jgi:hypothetical protein
MHLTQTRRRFLTALSGVSAAGLVRAPRAPAAEALVETTTVRLAKTDGICIAPNILPTNCSVPRVLPMSAMWTCRRPLPE